MLVVPVADGARPAPRSRRLLSLLPLLAPLCAGVLLRAALDLDPVVLQLLAVLAALAVLALVVAAHGRRTHRALLVRTAGTPAPVREVVREVRQHGRRQARLAVLGADAEGLLLWRASSRDGHLDAARRPWTAVRLARGDGSGPWHPRALEAGDWRLVPVGWRAVVDPDAAVVALARRLEEHRPAAARPAGERTVEVDDAPQPSARRSLLLHAANVTAGFLLANFYLVLGPAVGSAVTGALLVVPALVTWSIVRRGRARAQAPLRRDGPGGAQVRASFAGLGSMGFARWAGSAHVDLPPGLDFSLLLLALPEGLELHAAGRRPRRLALVPWDEVSLARRPHPDSPGGWVLALGLHGAAPSALRRDVPRSRQAHAVELAVHAGALPSMDALVVDDAITALEADRPARAGGTGA